MTFLSISQDINMISNSTISKKQIYENIYNRLKGYMFYPDVIRDNVMYCKDDNLSSSTRIVSKNDKIVRQHKNAGAGAGVNANANANAHNHKEIEKKKEEESPFFIPQEKDKLFWCLYIFMHSEYDYKIAKNNSNIFSIEKKWKMDTLDKLKEKEVIDYLKSIKTKSAEIEDELMNKEKLSLKGLQIFCFIYKLSVIYVSGRTYCEFLYGNVCNVIINTPNKEDGIHRKTDDSYIQTIRTTYWKIENVNKPLKSASAYTLTELQDICSKMGIALDNAETKKKKTMKVLYQELLSHF